jgi:dolichol-phosphate mannosyltransferase
LYAVSKAIGTGLARTPVEEKPSAARATSFWLLAGLAFGGALLSKYTAVLLGASLGLFLLISSAHRHWLRRPQPWLAGIVALLVFSPVIIWNVQHEWASFLFQSTRTAGQEPQVLKTVATFWLFQLGVLGPLLVVFAIATWQGVQRGWLKREDRWNFAVSFSVPLFLIFVLASFKTEVHINWTAPCFLSLLPAVAAIFREGMENKLRSSASRWRWFGATVAGLAVCGVGFAFSLTLWGVPSALTSSRSGGWREIAAHVRAEEADLARSTGQRPFVVGADKYNLSALLGFYNRAPHDQVNNLAFGKHGLGFRYWTDLQSFEGRPAVVVESRLNAGSLRNLTNHFDQVDAAKSVVIPTFGKRTRTVWLIDCYGYHLDPIVPQHAAARTNRSSLNKRSFHCKTSRLLRDGKPGTRAPECARQQA